MISTTANRAHDVAHELFGVVTHICLSTLRGRRRHGSLKEIEFLTLSLLQDQGTMIVGNIQRLLGVLPAQMSRVIRALENRDQPLIECRINLSDKRKVDVRLTPAGAQALLEFQKVRIHRLAERMGSLTDGEQDEVLRVLAKLHLLLEQEQHQTR